MAKSDKNYSKISIAKPIIGCIVIVVAECAATGLKEKEREKHEYVRIISSPAVV